MLTFLGVGSAFNPEAGNTSAYMIENQTLYLIDCGELIFKELVRHIPFSEIKEVTIFITHTHADHIGSLGTFIAYLSHYYQIKPTIYHAGVEIEDLLTRMGITSDSYYEMKIQKVDLGYYTFEWVRTKHTDKLACFGLLIETDEKTIYYSGDSTIIPQKIYDRFLLEEISTLYQDVTLASESKAHLPLEELADLIPFHLRDRVIAMHLDADSVEPIQELGFQTAEVHVN